MRKAIIKQSTDNDLFPELNFLDLELLTQIELTSEAPEYPIESAVLLTEKSGQGWQAASAGEQIIRIVFDQPRTIEHIVLVFDELQQARTQEFVLLWRLDKDSTYREVMRQQYHFSPPNTTREIEHYTVNLAQLKALELRIIPDMSGAEAYAKLKQLRLA